MPPSQPANQQPSQPPVPPNGTLGIVPEQAFPTPPDVPQPVAPGQPAAGGSAQTPATKPPVNQNTAQNTLQIAEVRENMVVMRDGSFRAVVACKSINFDLMSGREREGVEYSYQNFLNSLYFPVQIFIRSQRVDIGPYIDRLMNMRRNQDNMLLGVLMDDYINFIDVLSQEANIMDKSFFIVVPYYPAGDLADLRDQAKGFFGKLFAKQSNETIKIDEAAYAKAKEEVGNRVNAVMSGLFQLGVKSVQLNTKELGELYYNIYNPDTAVREPLGDFDNVTSTYVKKGQGEATRPNLQGGV
jgi:type IV secretory pathway VirB4 component